jgi:hypothetical protein
MAWGIFLSFRRSYFTAIIRGAVMPFSILEVPVALHLIIAASAGVPTLDVNPSCRAAAAAQIVSADRMQACIETEQRARDQLIEKWTVFTAADRASCMHSMMTFEPTYTELLTCLEIANDTRKLPAE